MLLSSVEFDDDLVCPVLLQLRGERRGHFSRLAIGDNFSFQDGTVQSGFKNTFLGKDDDRREQQSMLSIIVAGSAQDGAADAAQNNERGVNALESSSVSKGAALNCARSSIDVMVSADEQAMTPSFPLHVRQFPSLRTLPSLPGFSSYEFSQSI